MTAEISQLSDAEKELADKVLPSGGGGGLGTNGTDNSHCLLFMAPILLLGRWRRICNNKVVLYVF